MIHAAYLNLSEGSTEGAAAPSASIPQGELSPPEDALFSQASLPAGENKRYLAHFAPGIFRKKFSKMRPKNGKPDRISRF